LKDLCSGCIDELVFYKITEIIEKVSPIIGNDILVADEKDE